MWFFIGPSITIALLLGAIWFRNKWVIDTFNSYGVYGDMAGLSLYKKYGLWHISNDSFKDKLTDKEAAAKSYRAHSADFPTRKCSLPGLAMER